MHKGWAINTQSKEGHGFLGKYWWFEKEPPTIPNHMEGYRTAVFPTRKDARKAIKKVRKSFPKARVERVIITVRKEVK